MGWDHPTVHGAPWEYLFDEPRLDVEQDFRMQAPGTFSKLSGVDGRYSGRLRKFPGFFRRYGTSFLPTTIGGFPYQLGGNLISFFKPFSIVRAPNSSQLIIGFVFVGRPTGGGNVEFLYVAYSVNGGTPTAETLYTPGGSARFAALDVAVDHHLLHIVGYTNATPSVKIERVARWCGEAGGWQSTAWDPVQGIQSAALGQVSTPEPSHFLTAGRYGFTYRSVFPEQGYYGPFIAPYEFEVTGTVANVWVRISLFNLNNFFADANVFTRQIIQTFRTVSNKYGSFGNEDPGAVGTFHLEAEWELPRVSLNMSGTAAINTWNGSSITSGFGSFASAAIGDVIYLGIRPSVNPTDIQPALVFRRRITAVTPDVSVSWEPVIPSNGLPSTFQLNYWISKTGDDSDTRGQFVIDSAYGIRWGWDRNRLRLRATPLDIQPDIPTGYSDDALAQFDDVAPEEFSTFKNGNPFTRLMIRHENLYIRVTRPSVKEGATFFDAIRWDLFGPDRKGLISVLNRRLPRKLTNRILALVDSDSYAVAVAQNWIIRIHRSAERLAVDPIHNRHGAGGERGALAVGDNLYLTSPVGILVCYLPSKEMDVMGATHKFFSEPARWRNDLASVKLAYDSELGAIIALNPVKYEALIIWLNIGRLTHLVDVPFMDVISQVDLQLGGEERALFFNQVANFGGGPGDEPRVYEIDALLSNTVRCTTMNETSGQTFNGLAHATSTTSVLQTTGGAVQSTAMEGHFLRIFSGTTGLPKGTGQAYRIIHSSITPNGVGGFSIAVIQTQSPFAVGFVSGDEPVGGDRYTIAAIPMITRNWPLSGDPQQPVRDMFRLKKTTAFGAVVADLVDTNTGSNPNLKLRYQLHGKDPVTPLNTDGATTPGVEGTLTETSKDTYSKFNIQKPILVPGVECWASAVDFSLLGLIVDGTIEGSKA